MASRVSSDGSIKRKSKNRFTKLFKSPSKRSTDANLQYGINALRVRLVIHHQFPGIELVSPTYVGNGVICCRPPDQRVDVGFTTQADFKINFSRGNPIDILMYEIKRKSTKRFNRNTTSSEDETTCTQLFIAWELKNSIEFCAFSSLIEHDKGCIWDGDNLMKLADWYNLTNIQYSPIEMTYLIYDNTVLMTKIDASYEEGCYKLEMTISEGSIKYNTQRPRYIDVER
jgi:hypothetical protein